jgi:hypothetical protein
MKEIEVRKTESLLDREVLKNTVAGVDPSALTSCSCTGCNIRNDNEGAASETRLNNC